MSENRDLAEPTREDRVSCLLELIRWLEQEGGSSRAIRVVKAVAKHDLGALRSGQTPSACEPATICAYLISEGERLTEGYDPGDVVRNSKPEKALELRLPRLAKALGHEGFTWVPRLSRVTGGGRSNPSLYRLELERRPVESKDEPDTEVADALSGRIRYEVEDVRAIWPLRWLFIPGGFELSFGKFRGFAFLVFLLSLLLLLAMLVGFAILTMGQSKPLGPGNYFALTMGVVLGTMVWQILAGFFRAPVKRIVPCPTLIMSANDFYGQIRCVRVRDQKISIGWISLVRISSQCPVCSGTIELEDGRLDFPGRMVGRCRDAPTEHVFSFDPISHSGQELRGGRPM